MFLLLFLLLLLLLEEEDNDDEEEELAVGKEVELEEEDVAPKWREWPRGSVVRPTTSLRGEELVVEVVFLPPALRCFGDACTAKSILILIQDVLVLV